MTQESFSVMGSLIGTNGDYDMSFEYEDSTGIEISEHVEGTDPSVMLNELCEKVITELLNTPEEEIEDEVDEEVDEYVAELEALVNELQEKNSSLERDISILQRRADDAVKDSKNEKDTDVGSIWSSKSYWPTKSYSSSELNDLIRKFFR